MYRAGTDALASVQGCFPERERLFINVNDFSSIRRSRCPVGSYAKSYAIESGGTGINGGFRPRPGRLNSVGFRANSLR